jgi:BMFP domain-containing protein YqiC
MLNPKQFDDMVKHLLDKVPPGVQQVAQDLEKNFRSVLQGGFSKLNLVSREEFDAQTGVLLRTREKLDALEKQVQELEAKLKKRKS